MGFLPDKLPSPPVIFVRIFYLWVSSCLTIRSKHLFSAAVFLSSRADFARFCEYLFKWTGHPPLLLHWPLASGASSDPGRKKGGPSLDGCPVGMIDFSKGRAFLLRKLRIGVRFRDSLY